MPVTKEQLETEKQRRGLLAEKARRQGLNTQPLVPIRRPEGTRGLFDNPNKMLDKLLGTENLDDLMPFDAKYDFGTIISQSQEPTETEDKIKLSMFYKSIANIDPKISFNMMDELNKIIVGGDTNPKAMWKHYQDTYLNTKTYVEALKHGYRRAGVMMTKQLAGLGKIEAEIGGRARDWLWGALGREKPQYSKDIDAKLGEWSEMMLAGVQEYYDTNKKEAIQVMPGLGYKDTLLQYVLEPKNLVQGIVESSPLILEGILGTVFGGAGGAITTMAVPITGEVYASARAEGTEPLPALAQAILTGTGEATIEQWTLGKKLGLLKNYSKMVAQGLSKVVWEGVKVFFRGTAEEGSQEFNRNFWQWVFTDRSQQWSENVAESAAAGGPMELVMGGAFATTGAAAGAVTKDQQTARLDQIAEAVESEPTLSETHKVEIRKELDKVEEAIENDEFIVGEEVERPPTEAVTAPQPPTEAITTPEGEIVAPEAVGEEVKISKQEEFTGAAKIILGEPNTTFTQLALGKEKLTETIENFYSTTARGGLKKGQQINFNLEKWEADDGRIRYIAKFVDESGKVSEFVSSAAQIKLIDGVPEIQTVASAETKIGLGTAIVEQIQKDFGDFTFKEPISKAGERLLQRVGKLTPTPEAKPTEKQPWETSDLATAPNIPESRVKAERQTGGKYKLMFRGTSNEVFEGELFNSASEAKQFFKVQKLKAQQAQQPTENRYEGIDTATKESLLKGLFEDADVVNDLKMRGFYEELKASFTEAEKEEFKDITGILDKQIAHAEKIEPIAKAQKVEKKPTKIIEKKAEGPIQKFIRVEKEVIPKQTKKAFTPPEVQKEIEAETPEADSETQNATNLMEGYWAEFDVRELEINVAATKNQEAIVKALGKKQYLPESDAETNKISQAMMLYIDLREHPSGEQFVEKITSQKKVIYDLSQNLPANIQKIADNIIEQNRVAGALAVEKDVIQNARENYIAHIWEKPVRKEALRARFRQTTARARHRTLEGGIMEGWVRGKKLRIDDVTLATQIAQSQINQAIVGREMLNLGKKWGLLSHKQAEDWVKVEHPGFTTWKWAGKAEKGKTYGRNFFRTENGDLMERVPVYAEPELGKVLNNIFTPSGLYGKGQGKWASFVKTVTRYNAQIKTTILFTSLYHHQAYLRSYAFGSRGLNPAKAYKQGRQSIMNMTPEVRLLVRNGLTIGRIQDYDPRMIEGEQTIWGKALSTTNITESARKKLVDLRKRQERFLFNKLGPALKIQAGILELKAELKRNQAELESGEITADEIAAAVANLMNNDFGGLHLGRMGRSQTAQHVFRLLVLAPDWTESNIRSAVQAFAKGETGYLHRMFWGRIAMKGLGATILFNLLLSAFDDDDFAERYKKAWKANRLRWLDIDITPIHKALGGDDDKRKYFSLLGHFRDPIKFTAHPFVSAKHKGSVVSRIGFDMMTGTDWAGRKFTTLGELTGITEDGKNSGRLVKYSREGLRPIEPSQIPSYALYEVRSAMPIPMQNLIAFLGGEMDAFDAITKSAGLMTATTYPERRAGGRKQISRTGGTGRKEVKRK